jgi:hypothetical protein
LRELGVIVVAPIEEAVHASKEPHADAASEIATLSLPPRRWPSVPNRTFAYYFVPPRQCGGGGERKD